MKYAIIVLAILAFAGYVYPKQNLKSAIREADRALPVQTTGHNTWNVAPQTDRMRFVEQAL